MAAFAPQYPNRLPQPVATMLPAERNPAAGSPSPQRRNTLQRMLDLERKNKVNRMQATGPPSRPISRSSTSLGQVESSVQTHITSIEDRGRTMSTPALTVNIPQPNTHTKYMIKDGEIVPATDATEEDNDSDASSICHSPGWDDMMGTKKKKERKERKKAEAKALAKAKAEAKQSAKIRSRLSKGMVPANKRISKTGVPMDRSQSAPILLKTLEPLAPLTEESFTADTPKRVHMDEHALKTFIQATQAVPVPWRSSHGTPMESTSQDITPTEGPTSSVPPPPSNDGFIGGLKLRLADEAVNERIRARSTSVSAEKRIKSSSDPPSQPPQLDLGGHFDSQSFFPNAEDTNERPSTSGAESTRTPQQWESIYEQAARMMRTPDGVPTGPSEAHVERSRKGRSRAYPPTSSYFPMEDDHPSSRRDSSAASQARTTSRPRTSEDKDSHRRTSSAYSSDRPSLNTRDTSVDREVSAQKDSVAREVSAQKDPVARGSGGQQHTTGRNQSMPRTGHVRGDSGENVGVATRGRTMSWTNFSRNSSREVPAHNARPASRDAQTRFAETSASPDSPALTPDQDTQERTAQSSLLNRRNSAKNNMVSLSGFKSAAKAAFSRNSTASPSPTSPTDSPSSTNGRPHLKQGPSNPIITTDARQMRKAEAFFGQPISATIVDISPKTRSAPVAGKRGERVTSDDAENFKHPSGRERHHSHSRSGTDSSEDYSTLDEASSSATTPVASATPSHKDYSPQIHDDEDDDLVSDQLVQFADTKRVAAIMTNALPPPKNPRRKTVEFPQFQDAPVKEDLPTSRADELRNSALLSRSVSSPDILQDLSFLPALKHQPLTKPQKDSDASKLKPKRPPPQAHQNRSSPTGPRSESLPPVLADKEPAVGSPISSQYLQNARLSLPRQPQKSPGSGQEPVAKMFVICCSCKYYHDMPSKIYECMARSESVVEDKDLGVRGLVSTSVRCPWCNHGMTTSCCAGYAAVVVLREKLH